MALRKIVQIDEEKCNGCGLCIPNCAEGALQIVDGKAKIVKDSFCDGLGACLGHCPEDAIQIIERDADEFDEEEVEKHLAKKLHSESDHECGCNGKDQDRSPGHGGGNGHGGGHGHGGGGCPGSMMRQFNTNKSDDDKDVKVTSKLSQWPVQLMLVPVNAPYFKNADLLITADCVPFAYANYHNDYLKGKSVVIGCPKLDDVEHYVEKLSNIIKNNDLESVTVLKMEVPCCGGMAYAAKQARDKSGINIPIKVVTISLQGEALGKEFI